MVSLVKFAVVVSLGLSAAGCDWMKKKDPPGMKTEAEIAEERTQRIRRACASDATYDRLKELAFDQAARIRGEDPRRLDALAAAAVVRMEDPVVKSRDEDLNVTVCRGRFILELPPGSENAFDGERRLSADIEYAAQAALDGSGLVYQMDGAEPLVYRLATAGGIARPAPVTVPPPSGVPAAPRVQAAEAPPVATTPPAQKPAPQTPSPAASPSFNCNNARTRSERMVCGSASLAAKDREMSSLFYRALADADGQTRRELRRTRDDFLAYRERCSSEACIAQSYDGRMREIRDIMAGR
jgi:uncharacterized protein YecT (DUF1311 family)